MSTDSKSKDPAFLFYHQDFFSGVSDMTNEEIGAYIKCMCVQASKGGITEKHMLIICNSYEVHNIIKSKFILNDETNLFENTRLKHEIEKRKKYSESRANNRKGNKTDSKHMSNISSTYVLHMENENENENKDVIIPEVNVIKIKEEKFNFRKSLINYGASDSLTDEWIQVRKTKKATNTKTAFEKFIKQVELTGISVNEVLELCVERSWGSFTKEYHDNLQLRKNNGTQSQQPKEKPFIGRATESVVKSNLEGWE